MRRRYVTPAEWDTPARDVTLDQVELWCFSCCTHYPHEQAAREGQRPPRGSMQRRWCQWQPMQASTT